MPGFKPFTTLSIFLKGLRSDVEKHNREQLTNHVEDLVKTVDSLKSTVAEMEVQIRKESDPREQACLNELSAGAKQQQQQIDEMRGTIDSLSNTVYHLERQQEELRARQEKPLQEMNIR